MSSCLYNLAEDRAVHGLFAHQIDIFTAAVVVDVIETVRVREPCFIHS